MSALAVSRHALREHVATPQFAHFSRLQYIAVSLKAKISTTPWELSLFSAAVQTSLAPCFNRAFQQRCVQNCQQCLLAHLLVTPHLENFTHSQNPPDLLRRVFQHGKTVSPLSQSLIKALKEESHSLSLVWISITPRLRPFFPPYVCKHAIQFTFGNFFFSTYSPRHRATLKELL